MSMHGVDELERCAGLPTNAAGVSGRLVHSYFKREVGPVARATLELGVSARLPKPSSQAAQNGARYEKKVLDFLQKTFGNRLLPGPVFYFQEWNEQDLINNYPNGVICTLQPKRAIPDALLFSSDFRAVCVIEVKLRHTGDAWHQLNRFYLPIVKKALPWARVCALELTSQYDPFQRLPQEVAFVENAEQAFATREAFHPVMIVTARDLRNDRLMG